ncbi:MAG: glycosyl hydrolase [Chloroflexi bacterium]|nr:MAG: glycosyl hydrolase [Chloroflexota bacterium]
MSSATVGIPGDHSSLVARLDLEQKIRLLTGADSWVLYGENTIGLRPMVLSDGPAGVRGRRFDSANPSSSLPCPVALGATWDPGLIEELATALGREARAKGVDVILGPTINIVRTPLSGRGFECFSEDPLLTSRMAVAYVRGVQKTGVGATAKHFVANDSETERHTYDARITDKVLRELYLPPFEACVAEADVYLIMAAYNSVNGATMTANPRLLQELLKGEWGFDGVVVSDWSATTSTAPSANAGLDLVMPGPHGPWGERLLAAVRQGQVPETAIDDKIERLLRLASRVGALNGAPHLDGAGPAATHSSALIEPALLREVAARSFVLLKNPRGLLPLHAGSVERVALIGPNAIEPQTQGGGSVRVLAAQGMAIADAVRDGLDAYVSVHQGAITSATVALPHAGTLHDPVSGKAGVRLEVRGADGTVLYDSPFANSVVTWWDGLPEAAYQPGVDMTMRARYKAGADGPMVIGAAGVGRLRISLNDAMLAQASSLPPRDVVEALSRPPELRVPVHFEAGREVEVRVDYRPDGRFAALRLGIEPQADEDSLLEQAVKAAAGADVAIVVVGSADGTESEGYDRQTLVLPGRQDELIRRVAAANPNTVVVVNSGMPVLMPWADDVSAILQVWFPGQAFGEALADALAGIVEPGGRLPVSLPRVEADSPVLGAHPEAGNLVYEEGLLVGYRGYDRHGPEPLFCFGHGLGYTDWTYEAIDAAWAGEDVEVNVTVRNSGTRAGREVVQLYLEEPEDDAARPLRALAAFASVGAEPGERVRASLTVPARSFARYDEASREWLSHAGTYTLRAGRSSRDLRLNSQVVLR